MYLNIVSSTLSAITDLVRAVGSYPNAPPTQPVIDAISQADRYIANLNFERARATLNINAGAVRTLSQFDAGDSFSRGLAKNIGTLYNSVRQNGIDWLKKQCSAQASSTQTVSFPELTIPQHIRRRLSTPDKSKSSPDRLRLIEANFILDYVDYFPDFLVARAKRRLQEGSDVVENLFIRSYYWRQVPRRVRNKPIWNRNAKPNKFAALLEEDEEEEEYELHPEDLRADWLDDSSNDI